MADTLFDGFSDYTYFQSGDILIAQRGAGGINVPVDALMFKDANSIFNTLGRSMNLSADGDYLGIGAYFASGQWRNSVASQGRSEEHTSELQSLMRISYAVFCLKKKKNTRK